MSAGDPAWRMLVGRFALEQDTAHGLEPSRMLSFDRRDLPDPYDGAYAVMSAKCMPALNCLALV